MPARRATSADPALDLSYLTESEKRQLVQVLQRDGEIQETEKTRILKLKSYVRQEDRSAEALLQRGDFNDRYCIRCYRRFLLLINPWVCCCLCSLRVCKGRCAQRSPDFSGAFLCHVCDRSRLCLTGQCQWFYDAVKKRFRNSGSAKVYLSLNRDEQHFAEACESASNKPGLTTKIEQLFTAKPASLYSDSNQRQQQQQQQQQQLADSGHGGSLGYRRGVYRTELTFATMATDELDSTRDSAAAAAAAPAAAEEAAASTVGPQVTAFQGQLHDLLRRLQAELRTRVADDRAASNAEAKEVADRYSRDIAELISTFAQTLHATLASRDGSPCTMEDRLQRVQRVVQQEVEHAIGLSVDRVVSGHAGAAAVAAAVAAGSEEDADDSGLELEGRLADFVVQKVVDDHLVLLMEQQRQQQQQELGFLGYRQLPSSLTGGGEGNETRASGARMPLGQSAGGQLEVEQHIDSLFAFKSSDDSNGSRRGKRHSGEQPKVSSTPKFQRASGTRNALPLPPPPPPPQQQQQQQRADLRLGRFASRVAYDDAANSDSDSGDSWDRAAPVLATGSAPLRLRFGAVDWSANGRTDPRFCARPEAKVTVPRGERATFTVVVDGTEPIDVVWHLLSPTLAYEICDSDKYELTPDTQGVGSHSLTVYHTADSDSGPYLVIASNELQTVMHGFKLLVVDNPQQFKAPAFTEPMSDSRAREGRTARFRCRVAGVPTPRVTFLRDGAPIRPDGVKYHLVNLENCSYELQINDVTKADDAEYSCLATNAAGTTQCDCQLLVYKLAEEDEALRRIEGEIQQTQASMISAAKDMYKASGKIRQLDAHFGRLNQRLSSMEKQLVTAYPESSALQRITGHMVARLADHETAAAAAAAATAAVAADSEPMDESSVDATPASDWSAARSSFESIPQVSSSSKIVYETENVVDASSVQKGDGGEGGGVGIESDADLAATERRIYIAASKNSLMRQRLDELERQISRGSSDAGGGFDVVAMEQALAGLQQLADQSESEVASIETKAGSRTA